MGKGGFRNKKKIDFKDVLQVVVIVYYIIIQTQVYPWAQANAEKPSPVPQINQKSTTF